MVASVGFHLKLHPERDADLIAAIELAEDKSARWRELARKGLAVERSTISEPENVLRRTNSVERSTVKPEPPQRMPAEFVPPPGFAMMPSGQQKRIRNEWFAEQERLRK